MKVVARRRQGFTHEVEIESGHTLVIDEPTDRGGADARPLPHPHRRRRARRLHRDHLRDVRRAQGLGAGRGRVRGRGRTGPRARCSSGSTLTLRIPEPLTDEQRERLLVIAGKCPVHRALAGESKVVDQRSDRSRLMDLGLGGRACAVTGASRGIGRETARMLCAEGASVLLVARGPADLADAAAECADVAAERRPCRAASRSTSPMPDAGERIARGGEAAFGQLDVLVNNAGTARWRDLDEVPDADWQAAWELNVMAPMRLMRAAIPAMAERGWGRIVNVASTAAKRPSAQMAEYSVAKAAQLSLSRLYADRYAEDGVLVNAICPGPTKSELWMAAEGLLDQSREQAGPRHPRAGARGGRREAADRPPGGGRGDRRGDRLPRSERASYVAGAAWSVDGGTVQVII